MKRVLAIAVCAVAVPLAAAQGANAANSEDPRAVAGGDCWPAQGSAAMCVPFDQFLRWFLPSLSANSGSGQP
ncbi:hypothetical protein [Nocardia bovistercoris]|uniref:Secreted protein n=1 Tax=Nocardia bovistercoris TaxID=2785916 RepID=A0A931I7B4_9NOCA|nr:hypothetical protein [Nocardia bovistercoris]MBH0775974.1 hypothetical protein [Nocardia bovistercoris]